jgi:phosphoribosylglycinamide formyltransferase 1
MKKIVILISGRGSNLQALLSAGLPCRVAAVISNRAEVRGLEVAGQHGIATRVVSHRDYPDRASFDNAMAELIDSFQPDFVVLAGFMRILTEQFVNHYRGRLINIHPSLLPAYTGMNTHERALQDGVKIHGCTVHFVTPDLDHGPIIIQAAVPVLGIDTPLSLSERVLEQEHVIFPQAIRWLCSGKVSLGADGRVLSRHAERADDALISPYAD